MKKITFSILLTFAISLCSFAQSQICAEGTTTSSSPVIYSKVNYNGNLVDIVAIRGESQVTPGRGVGVSGKGGLLGVFGVVTDGGTAATTGVSGSNQSTGTGIKYGVRGHIWNMAGTGSKYAVYGLSPVTTSSWALYGAGDIYYTGTMTATSDKRLKKDIKASTEMLDKVLALQPKQYRFKTKEYKNLHLASGEQFGFLAQEVEELFPNLVKTDLHSFSDIDAKETELDSDREELEIKSLNYIGFIPILTKAIQEQQDLIVEKEERIVSLEKKVAKMEELLNKVIESNGKLSTQTSVIENARLGQNMPNPFNNNTTIPYSIPQDSQKAFVQIHGINGQLIKSIPINTFGEGTIELQTQSLGNGQYSYTLEVDGRVIDTKKMNLVR